MTNKVKLHTLLIYKHLDIACGMKQNDAGITLTPNSIAVALSYTNFKMQIMIPIHP